MFFILCIFLFLFPACESRVSFLIEGEDCIVKTVGNREVCVKKKAQVFRTKGLKDHPVTFLFVMDVSDSMQDDLARIGRAFIPLISHIQEADWQFLFTTADHGDHHFTRSGTGEKIFFPKEQWQNYRGTQPYFGQFMPLEYQGKLLPAKLLSKDLPEYRQIFKDTLTRNPGNECTLPPFCQGAMEQPLRALNASLERLALARPSLLHRQGDIVAFLVTDEDERAEDSERAETAESVVRNAEKLFPAHSFHAFTMVVQDDHCLSMQREYTKEAMYGNRVKALALLTQGKSVSLCEEDYEEVFAEISQVLRRIMEPFHLREKPVLPELAKVHFIEGQPAEWHLDGRKLLFESPLESGARFKISYWVLDKDAILAKKD